MTRDPLRAASQAGSWDELGRLAGSCTACPELAAVRTCVVPGHWPPGAQMLLVGEAPGAAEDASGLPFVGRSGQLLDTLLAEAGLTREQVAVTNILKCRPPGNRAPKRAEARRCRPWLARQIDLMNPLVLVTLGSSAAAWFFGPGARIADLRASTQDYDDRPVQVTYHPSAAIRFGPRGAPLAALRADLATAAGLLDQRRLTRPSAPAPSAVR